MTNSPPAYLSQRAFDELLSSWGLVDGSISRVLYEGDDGTARDVGGYLLNDTMPLIPTDQFVHIAPVRYFERDTGGPRLNNGGVATTVSIPVNRIVSITRESRNV